jgi:hypothetical protein
VTAETAEVLEAAPFLSPAAEARLAAARAALPAHA